MTVEYFLYFNQMFQTLSTSHKVIFVAKQQDRNVARVTRELLKAGGLYTAGSLLHAESHSAHFVDKLLFPGAGQLNAGTVCHVHHN